MHTYIHVSIQANVSSLLPIDVYYLNILACVALCAIILYTPHTQSQVAHSRVGERIIPTRRRREIHNSIPLNSTGLIARTQAVKHRRQRFLSALRNRNFRSI